MNLTNKFNLPQPFVDAVKHDDYQRGTADFTATELVRPARIQALMRKYGDQIEEDASERVWALSGQARHVVLQRIAASDPDRYLVEERFEAKCPRPPNDPLLISAKLDLYDLKEHILYDWKETSVWKFIMGDTREWEEQANINLYCLRLNGFEVSAVKNIAILKDWKARKARTSKRDEYPQCAIHVCDLPMWSIEQAQDYIRQRANIHEASIAEVEAGNQPILCTRKERWQRDQTFALMKKGRKRAIKLFTDEDQANAAKDWYENRAKPGEKFELETRPTEPVRCLDFCPVSSFCDFGKKAQEDWRSREAI